MTNIKSVHQNLTLFLKRLETLKAQIKALPKNVVSDDDFKQAFQSTFPDLSSLPLTIMTDTSTQARSNSLANNTFAELSLHPSASSKKPPAQPSPGDILDFKALIENIRSKNSEALEKIQTIENFYGSEDTIRANVSYITSNIDKIVASTRDSTERRLTLVAARDKLTKALDVLDLYETTTGVPVTDGLQESYMTVRDFKGGRTIIFTKKKHPYTRTPEYKLLHKTFLEYQELGGEQPNKDRNRLSDINSAIESIDSNIEELKSQELKANQSSRKLRDMQYDLANVRSSVLTDDQIYQIICDKFFKILTNSSDLAYLGNQLASNMPKELAFITAARARSCQITEIATILHEEITSSILTLGRYLSNYNNVMRRSPNKEVDFVPASLDISIKRMEQKVANLSEQFRDIDRKYKEFKSQPAKFRTAASSRNQAVEDSTYDNTGNDFLMYYLYWDILNKNSSTNDDSGKSTHEVFNASACERNDGEETNVQGLLDVINDIPPAPDNRDYESNVPSEGGRPDTSSTAPDTDRTTSDRAIDDTPQYSGDPTPTPCGGTYGVSESSGDSGFSCCDISCSPSLDPTGTPRNCPLRFDIG